MTPFVTNNGNTAPNFTYGLWDDLGNYYGVLMNGGETTDVVNLFETEEYAELCKVMHDWYEKGYSNTQCLQPLLGWATADGSLSSFFFL